MPTHLESFANQAPPACVCCCSSVSFLASASVPVVASVSAAAGVAETAGRNTTAPAAAETKKKTKEPVLWGKRVRPPAFLQMASSKSVY